MSTSLQGFFSTQRSTTETSKMNGPTDEGRSTEFEESDRLEVLPNGSSAHQETKSQVTFSFLTIPTFLMWILPFTSVLSRKGKVKMCVQTAWQIVGQEVKDN